MKKKQAIGVFDSGLGGLTAVRELIRLLPSENIVYFGDTARVPYGTKSRETIIRFSIENILFLLQQNVKLVVIACNTSSSTALPLVQSHFRVPITGVIEPGVKEAVRVSRNGRIGVIGTRTTIRSREYEKQLRKQLPDGRIYNSSCPLFVPLVEEGWLNDPETEAVVRRYLQPLKEKGVDTLVLGCTHYPLLKTVIKRVMGSEVKLVDSARQVASRVREMLTREKLLDESGKKGCYRFFVSDEPDNFAALGKKFLGFSLENVRKVTNV